MKKGPYFLLTICLLVVLSSSIHKLKKPKIGTDSFVKMSDGSYVDPYELTVQQYSIFITSLKNNGQEDLAKKYAVDSNKWVTAWPNVVNESMKKVYNNHPYYDDYPVVNLSIESIQAYCKWRTDSYNSTENRTFKKVEFRLPNEKEWMRYASPAIGYPFPWTTNVPYDIDKKGEIVPYANLKLRSYADGGSSYYYDGFVYTAPVNSFKPNSLGLYNGIGNVAELCSDSTIKGGGYDNTPEQSRVDKKQAIALPHPTVGFRLLMAVIEE